MIKYKGISTLEVLQEAKNYNKWIADKVIEHIASPSLEIGAGTGNLTEKFINTKLIHITDIDHGLVVYLKKKFLKNKNIITKQLDITKKIPNRYREFFNSVYAINVLEHIENDDLALKNISKVLKKNGKIILLIPAKKFAYTKLDSELGHFRRYEKTELLHKLEANGYIIESIEFFNILGLLSWYIRDKVKRKNIGLKPYHITLFDKVVPWLRFIESKIKIPVGISLIAVARKK